jgi:hypothetical protein
MPINRARGDDLTRTEMERVDCPAPVGLGSFRAGTLAPPTVAVKPLGKRRTIVEMPYGRRRELAHLTDCCLHSLGSEFS